MKIEWRNIGFEENEIIENWLSNLDRQSLCMANKNWAQTAEDIEDCLKYMRGGQFKNLMGYLAGKPAVALMFGIEHEKTLNLYNIVVNPAIRGKGVATDAILSLTNNDKALNITQPYNKIVVSALPENSGMQSFLNKNGFSNLGFNGEYVVFKKSITKEREM